jgi:predicted anti-sigma-YlaC factor YlaD
MKCIDNELIQKYIDGETKLQETDLIEKHVAHCSKCVQNIKEQKTFAENIKLKIRQLDKQPVFIPEFVKPDAQKRDLNLKIRHIVYAVSAACAIFLFVFLLPKQSKETDFLMIYCLEGDFDSNKPFSQQEMVIKIIDSNGKIVDYY